MLSSDSFGHVTHSNCLSCQNQFTDEYKRKAHAPSVSTALNFETEEPSLSMLIWDQNHYKSICPTYDPILTNNGSKLEMNNGN